MECYSGEKMKSWFDIKTLTDPPDLVEFNSKFKKNSFDQEHIQDEVYKILKLLTLEVL